MELGSFQAYLVNEKRYSAHTVTAYLNDLNQFIDYLDTTYEIKEVNSVTIKHIRSFLAEIVNNGLANRSVNRKLSSIKKYFAYKVSQNVIAINPASLIESLKLDQKLPESIEVTPLDSFLSQLSKNDFSSYRDFLLVYLLYSLGLRRSELIELKDQDIDFRQKTIEVFGKGKKTRRIPVKSELLDHLLTYKEYRNAEFASTETILVTDKGDKMYPNFVYRKIQTLLSYATKSQKRSPHILRHSFASHLLNQGADIVSIKELLGHESLQATQIYTHTNIEELKKIYKKSHPSSNQK